MEHQKVMDLENVSVPTQFSRYAYTKKKFPPVPGKL